MALNSSQVKSKQPGAHADGGGLYLIGFFRIFGAGTIFRVFLCLVESSGCQYSAPEKCIGGAPVHLALNRLGRLI
jgi:hypothetical protein